LIFYSDSDTIRVRSPVAQLVEQVAVNHRVAGSNPARGAKPTLNKQIFWPGFMLKCGNANRTFLGGLMPKVQLIVRSRAPVRICDLGGWTDTWFAKFGTVFNIAVAPTVEVQIITQSEPNIEVFAENFGYRFRYDPKVRSKHPLIDACIERAKLPKDLGLKVAVYSRVPGGASTGTSAAVGVALLAALHRLKSDASLTPAILAKEAHAVETEMLGQQSGIQDQLAAAFGGINLIEMSDYPSNTVSRITLSTDIRNELNSRLLLFYLGKPHSSSEIHLKVINELEGIGPNDTRLEGLRMAAKAGAAAVRRGDLGALGEALLLNVENQAALHHELVSPHAHKIFSIARKHHALGWKVNGAGGDGGSVTILCGEDLSEKRKMVEEILSALPGTSEIPVEIANHGATAWTTPSDHKF
jgi:D-glycero-alpha-D-manno-heptose-7-phosphate kinase